MVEIIYNVDILEDYGKVATIDMGGTLVEDTSGRATHARLNTALGMSEKTEKEIYYNYEGKNGDLTDHIEHARAQTDAIRGRSESTLENYAAEVQEILDDRELIDGAEEFVQELENSGYETVVLSSAPIGVARPFAEELEVDKLYRWKDFIFTGEGYFDRVFVNEEGRKGKHQIVERIMELGSEVAHFGNGANDEEAVEMADNGLKQYWTGNPDRAFERALSEV